MTTIFYVDFEKKTLIETCEVASAKIIPIAPSDKFQYFEKLINTGLVQVLVNPSAKGVALPEYLMKELVIPINWSFKFQIPDFVFDAEGIRGTLSFGGKPTLIKLPWESIWAIMLVNNVKDTAKIWENDAPPEVSTIDLK